jgi:hypothetical protein
MVGFVTGFETGIINQENPINPFNHGSDKGKSRRPFPRGSLK